MAPKPKAPDWLFDRIDEASKNARKIYFLYIGLLAYSVLTIVSTSDRQIILNETATLPILKLDVSLNGFFLVAPLIAILVFIYFQLYLHSLKGLIDDLRTNYAWVEKRRLYPWMINIAEDPEPGAIGALQRIIVSFSLWTSLTLVLILFALWYVKKHEPIWSYIVGSGPILGCMITFWFWLRYEPGKLRKSTWRKIFSLVGFFLVIAFELCLFFLLIPWAREGGKYEWIRPLICINLSYQNLVTEPKKDYKGLYWGNFNEAHLEGAILVNAVLERADLRNAQLQGAALHFAILEGAHLQKANLHKAHLAEANLQEANLEDANLQEAILSNANLQKAVLVGAHLEKGVLIRSNLRGVNLGGAHLQQAYLWKANLQEGGLVRANLQGANLEEANLQEANLWEAHVQGADLRGANLREAVLGKANLQEAFLVGADLREARNLTIEQLSKVKTLYEAKLDSELLEQIKEEYPHLLEKPKPEK